MSKLAILLLQDNVDKATAEKLFEENKIIRWVIIPEGKMRYRQIVVEYEEPKND